MAPCRRGEVLGKAERPRSAVRRRGFGPGLTCTSRARPDRNSDRTSGTKEDMVGTGSASMGCCGNREAAAGGVAAGGGVPAGGPFGVGPPVGAVGAATADCAFAWAAGGPFGWLADILVNRPTGEAHNCSAGGTPAGPALHERGCAGRGPARIGGGTAPERSSTCNSASPPPPRPPPRPGAVAALLAPDPPPAMLDGGPASPAGVR
mmetsp:Transcript_29720/g.64950  ORF Transcript_29720/g.64950 Transcript_29720/m.64950 type:complete len:206 (+) Transcript_29720:534-1151(+)